MEKPRGVPDVEKRVILAALLFAAVQLAVIAYAAMLLGVTVPSCVTNVRPFTAGEVIAVGPGRYEVHVVARMWEFEPERISVPKGSIVDFYVTSADVTHGFYIHRTNVNLTALPSVVSYAQAHFNEAGKYPFLCHEFCGLGHHGMAGMVEVTP